MLRKQKVEEVNRTIKFVYADNVAGLAGTEVFPSQKQTVSYTGSIKLTAEGKAVINSNDRPVYINWKGTDGQSTDLPELAVPQKKDISQVLKKYQCKQQQLQMKITNMLLSTQQSKKRKQHS